MKKVWIINAPKKKRKAKRRPSVRARRTSWIHAHVVKANKRKRRRSVSYRSRLRAASDAALVRHKNPKRKRRPMARRKKARSAAQKAAFRKMLAARGAAPARRKRAPHKEARVAGKKRRKARRGGRSMRSVKRGGKLASRAAWSASPFRRNPRRRHRRRSFRRNPGFSITGIKHRVIQGVTDAAMVVGGKLGTRFLANLIPVPSLKDTPIKIAAVQLATAIALGIAGTKFLGGDKGRFITAGGIAGAIEGYLKTTMDATNPVAALLGDDALELGEGDGMYNSVGAYEGVNAYEAAALRGPGA